MAGTADPFVGTCQSTRTSLLCEQLDPLALVGNLPGDEKTRFSRRWPRGRRSTHRAFGVAFAVKSRTFSLAQSE